jgi:hypothetical protein
MLASQTIEPLFHALLQQAVVGLLRPVFSVAHIISCLIPTFCSNHGQIPNYAVL